MKKVLSFLLVAVMLIACMATTAFAAERGEVVSVTFSASGNPGFTNYGAQISYDSSALELTGISAGALSTGGLFMPNAANGSVGFAGATLVEGDGALFTATFKVKDTAAKGNYPVSATLTSGYGDANNPISFGITGATVTVTIPECAEHTYGDWSVTTAATCAVPGAQERVCSVCGHKDSAVIDQLTHTPEVVTGKAATCTEAGLTDGEKCSVCGTSITAQSEIPALGHKVDSWTVVTEATCTADGSKTGVCGTCGETITEVIPATGHKVGGWKTDANNHWHGCEVCGTELDKAAHDLKAVDGSKDKQCTVCGYRVEAPASTTDSTLDKQPKTGDIYAEMAMFAAVAALAVGAVVFAKRKARN